MVKWHQWHEEWGINNIPSPLGLFSPYSGQHKDSFWKGGHLVLPTFLSCRDKVTLVLQGSPVICKLKQTVPQQISSPLQLQFLLKISHWYLHLAQPKDVKCTACPPPPLIKHPSQELTQNKSPSTLLLLWKNVLFSLPVGHVLLHPPCAIMTCMKTPIYCRLFRLLCSKPLWTQLALQTHLKCQAWHVLVNPCTLGYLVVYSHISKENWDTRILERSGRELCFSQAEHLKCLAKETLLSNATVHFRLIYNNLSDYEMLKIAF